MKFTHAIITMYLAVWPLTLLTAQNKNRCTVPMSEASFAQLLNAVRAESFSNNKMETAMQGTRCLTVQQVRTLMNEFSFENEKLEFAKFAYPRTVDQENYYQLNSAFSFSASKTELSNFVRRQSSGPNDDDPEITTGRNRNNRGRNEQQPDPNPTVSTEQQRNVRNRNRNQNNQPSPAQPGDVYGWKAYQEALKKYQQYFDMVFGNEPEVIGDNQGPAPHRPDDDSRMPAKAPRIIITQPELTDNNGLQASVSDKKIKVEGVISSTVGIYEVFVNETEAILTPNGTFSAEVPLAPGENIIKIKAVDLKRQIASISFKAIRQYAAPTPPVVKEEPKPQPPQPTPNNENFVSDIDINLPASKMSNPQAVAVVIGNTAYNKTKPVDFATQDAKSVKNYLIQVLGYRPGNILFVENASLGDFNMLFGGKNNHKGRLFNTIKPNQSDVFIYYSGHGAPGLQDKKGYFVPVEADPNYIEQSGYCIETLFENLSKLPARSITLVADACFSGANVFENISPIVIKAKTPPPTVIKNFIFLSSSSGTEVSSWYNEQQHGLFTYFFLKAIQDRHSSDLNKDKKLTFEEIFKYVASNDEGVPYHARRLHGISQTPRLQGSNRQGIFVYYP